jgi:hypothetical protein
MVADFGKIITHVSVLDLHSDDGALPSGASEASLLMTRCRVVKGGGGY